MNRMTPWMCCAAALGLWACSDAEMPPAAEGETLYLENCAACHGVRGQGGELVGGQNAPDLTRIAARRGGDFPRAEILSRIDGYGRGHDTSQIMPEFGALLSGPPIPLDVDGVMTPTPRSLVALLTSLESAQVADG